jgi:hypothetical protein
MKTKYSFVVDSDIKSQRKLSLPVKWIQAVRIIEEAHILRESAKTLRYT